MVNRKVFKLLCAVLAISLLTITGCGGAQSQASSAAPAPAPSVAPAPASSTASSAPTETKYFTIGSGQATTSIYPYWVAIGKAISTIYPNFQTTVSECQGAVDITYRIRAGEIDFGNGVAGTDYNNFHGLVTFDGDPNPDARILWYYGYTLYEFVVTKESGVNSFTDLEGKKINDGGTGSSVALQTRDLFQVIGVNPIFYDASKNDAGDAYGNRQIVGMSTSSSLPNAFTMQLNAKLPSKILSMPDDMRKTLIEKFPYYLEATVPAGTYEGMDNDVKTLKFMQGCQSTPKLSQEDAYLIVKAVFGEGKSIWESVTPVYAAEDETELALNSPILLHAGMVQYLKEKGVSVPAKLIPPEYVDK